MADTTEIEYTVVEAATLAEVDCHPNTIEKALRDGSLAFRWKRGRRLILRSSLLSWAAKRRRRPGAPLVAPEAFAS